MYELLGRSQRSKVGDQGDVPRVFRLCGRWIFVYAQTFRRVWPDCRLADRVTYNECTVGDHLESFLGWHIYWVQVHQAEFPDQTKDVITCLQRVLFTSWALSWFY